MVKYFKFLIIIVALNSNCLGQTKLLPPESKINDSTLNQFINDLKDAIKNKDKDFIINHLSPQVMNSFGGEGGIDEFKSYWCWSCQSTSLWIVLDKILKLGGKSFTHGKVYSMPYVYSEWPGDELFDVFDYMAITGKDIEIRDKPNYSGSNVVGRLTFDIVKVNWDKSYPSFTEPKLSNVKYIGEKEWYYIESIDGKLSGFVNYDNIWSPIGYRIGFEYDNNKWLISFLVSGD
jgi:hypothetical protein